MPSKYKVTVWKTESYRTVVEVIAENRHKAQEACEEYVMKSDDIDWELCEWGVEVDVPTHGEYTDENV